MGRIAKTTALTLSVIACEGRAARELDTAWGACQQRVEQDLASPAHAVFPRIDSLGPYHAAVLQDSTATISAYVDAPNALGVLIRREFICWAARRSSEWWADSVVYSDGSRS